MILTGHFAAAPQCKRKYECDMSGAACFTLFLSESFPVQRE